MSTVIMMFILPLGILVYFWDRRNVRESLALFEAYMVKIEHSDLEDAEKTDRIDRMFYENGYKLVQKELLRLVVEKKHFNIGILFIMFGLMNYPGIFVYLIFYRFFLKPRRLCAILETPPVLRPC